MEKLFIDPVRQWLAAAYLLGGLFMAVISCTNFPTPFENVVANQKIRPFAVVCDPPEAAPGDTVMVRLYYYDPSGDSPAIHWTISLDYGTDLRGNSFEKHIVDLDSMMLPSSVPDSFRFRVPDSALLYSTQISEMVNNSSINPVHLTAFAIDSLLRSSDVSTPQMVALADNFSCKLKLRAQLRSAISLDVTMFLWVRYSGKFKSPDVNKNPSISWMGIIKVPTANYTTIDSLSASGYALQYLFNSAHPDSVADTVTIDSGYTYFVAADSSGNRQLYTYFSLQDKAIEIDTEGYNCSWFFTNLDYANGMVMDSLLIFGQGRSGPLRELLPPVDTAMHRFALYLTLRDTRRSDPSATPGEAFKKTNGYFSYTPSYARNAYRTAGRGRLL